jgi:hypothetical protein
MNCPECGEEVMPGDVCDECGETAPTVDEMREAAEDEAADRAMDAMRDAEPEDLDRFYGV